MIALGWLLRHPAKIIPIVGTTKPERIRALGAATEIALDRASWYRILLAARGQDLP